MKSVVACSLLLLVIYGCQRVCGDMQAIAEAEPAGGGGAGGDPAVTAGEGGAGPIPPINPGGMSGEGGGGTGGAGGASGAPSGDTCSTPPRAEITDFESAAPPALGTMMSDDEGPTGTVEPEMGTNDVYRERGDLPPQPLDQAKIGFRLTFNSCFDASSYTGIRFEARGTTPAGLDVSILTNSAPEPGNSQHVDVAPMGGPLEVCFPSDLDKKTLFALHFIYTPEESTGSIVDLSLDNFAFVAGECTGT